MDHKTIREMHLTPAQRTALLWLVARGPGYHRHPDRHVYGTLALLGLVEDFDAQTFGCNGFAVTPRGLWVAAVLAAEKEST